MKQNQLNSNLIILFWLYFISSIVIWNDKTSPTVEGGVITFSISIYDCIHRVIVPVDRDEKLLQQLLCERIEKYLPRNRTKDNFVFFKEYKAGICNNLQALAASFMIAVLSNRSFYCKRKVEVI